VLKSRGASETVNYYAESDQQPDASERVSLSPNCKFGTGGLADDNGDVLRDFSELGCCRKITTLLTSSHQFNNLQVSTDLLSPFCFYFISSSSLSPSRPWDEFQLYIDVSPARKTRHN
jgi:hypothetical protein